MGTYRFLDHTADLRIEVVADTMEGLFYEAATALFDITAGIRSIDVREFREVRASGDDVRELFVDWLRELLYRFSGEGMLFSQFEIVTFSETEICARCGGEPFDGRRHEVRYEIKAITYHGLEIVRREGQLSASVVFDI
jgi:SHS2 domain-containing protein